MPTITFRSCKKGFLNVSKVFLKRGTYQQFLKSPQQILEALKASHLDDILAKDQFLGLKIHFGEKQNKSYINPSFLVPLVKFLREKKTKPFLFETNTLYRGKRMNSLDHINLARSHGFGKLNLPIIIGDGLKGNDSLEVSINQKNFKQVYLASSLKDIDALLVLSHFTGHMLTGFGAAIKNLGMGCASRKGKLAQHCDLSPEIKSDKCSLCGICAKNCPAQAIEEKKKFSILPDKCIGCAQCLSVCPYGAIDVVWSEEYKAIGEKMVEYALGVSQKVKAIYINFCLFLTQECDCMNKEEKGIVPDLGILFSRDPVSLDKASIDLLTKQAGRDFLKQAHPKIDYLQHLQYANKLGLGSLDYELSEI